MKVYIINVSTNEYRRNHMLHQINSVNCLKEYEFTHEGDLDSLSQEILSTYFGGELGSLSPMVSCAYKHILAYEKIVKGTNELALILEDDIIFGKDFCIKLNKIINEVSSRNLMNFIISLEDSNLKYVKGSQRIKNISLYKESSGRMAGAYLIEKNGAISLTKEIKQNKCNLPIDWFHNFCSNKGIIDIYWAHPALATQGSLNGKMKSEIDDKKYGWMRVVGFKINRFYKKILYGLR